MEGYGYLKKSGTTNIDETDKVIGQYCLGS
jgi:hypothetical protein